MRVDLAGPIDVRDFRAQANSLLAQQVAPTDIDWHALASLACGSTFRGGNLESPSTPSALHSIVPRSFLRLTELVVLHRDPQRFDLLYRLLWRLVHERARAGVQGDADFGLARSMAQAVRRDIARARAAVRLRPLPARDGVTLAVAWCEPHHQVTEQVAEALVRLQPAPPWLLASPDRCVLWTGRHLLCGPGLAVHDAEALADEDWHALAERLAGRVAASID